MHASLYFYINDWVVVPPDSVTLNQHAYVLLLRLLPCAVKIAFKRQVDFKRKQAGLS